MPGPRHSRQPRPLDPIPLLERAADVIFVWRVDDGVVLWNRAAERLYGFAARDTLGLPPHTILRTEFPATLSDVIDALRRDGEWRGRLRQHARNGRAVDVESRMSAVWSGDELHVLEVSREVGSGSIAVETGQPFRDSPVFQQIIDSAEEGIAVFDRSRRCLIFNHSMERLTGLPARDAIGAAPAEALAALADEAMPEAVDRALAGEYLHRDAVLLPAREGGEPTWVSADHRPIVSGGRIVGVVVTARDITRRRRAEVAMLENEERTHFALQAARAGTWEMNLVSRRVSWSPTMYALFGISAAEFKGTEDDFFGRVLDVDRDAVQATLQRAIRGAGEFTMEFRVPWQDGSIHWHFVRAHVVADAAGRPMRLLGVDLDITDRRLLEAQFRQAQKMEAVGQLAGGVAHDFNNMLTAILGYANFLDEEVQDAQQRLDVQEIIRAASRAALLTRQLLAFSRRQVVETSVVDLNVLLGELSNMLTRLIGEHISMTTALSSEPAPVIADRTQLEQVVMNLVVNARDAMPNGGALRLETANIELDDEYALSHASARPGSYVVLTVTDTGEGMSEEVRARIFEPFFTTKGREKGTGLGLSTVYGIVSQAGGYVWVDSQPGRGTTFKVHLPRVVDARAAGEPPGLPPRVHGGQETVLLVEDEEPVRLLAKIILERAGYKVLDAPDPEAAVALFEEAGDAVDLLLSDIIMPGGTGPDLYRRLTERRPSLRALMMSGYTGNAAIDGRHFESEAAFLEKPFTAAALTRKVREVLDR